LVPRISRFVLEERNLLLAIGFSGRARLSIKQLLNSFALDYRIDNTGDMLHFELG